MRGENCTLAAHTHYPHVRNTPADLTRALCRSRLRVKSLPNCFAGNCLHATGSRTTIAHTESAWGTSSLHTGFGISPPPCPSLPMRVRPPGIVSSLDPC